MQITVRVDDDEDIAQPGHVDRGDPRRELQVFRRMVLAVTLRNGKNGVS